MNELEYLQKYYKGNIEEAIKRFNDGEPLQYIVGEVDFFGNTIKVTPDVLIPRFETEGLVEIVLNSLANENIDVVDLGTGSGCIAITLKKILPNINVDAVDISEKALAMAKKNAELNNVDINFLEGDMLKPLTKKYDCIISNPPYIAHDEEIMDIVKNNEPEIALYADHNGLYFYEQILENCKDYLKGKYYIFFEIGSKQGETIKSLALKYLNCNVEIKKDLHGFDRYVIITNR